MEFFTAEVIPIVWDSQMQIGEVTWMIANLLLGMCFKLVEQLLVGGARSRHVWHYQLLRLSVLPGKYCSRV